MDERSFRGLLRAGAVVGARDVHFRVGSPPLFRMLGELRPTTFPALDVEATDWIARYLATESDLANGPTVDEHESCITLEGVARFRLSIYRQMGSTAIVARVLQLDIPTIESLDLPASVGRIAAMQRGLVLVAGPAGSGKSSTQAAIVHEINRTRRAHIITIEDPVEFVHRDLRSSLSQREVGQDTRSYASALRTALRQDPDVILVGELRDLEAIEIALRAAETGHLVMATVHTADAIEALHRIVGVFSPEHQDAIRFRLSESLRAIVAQRLVPRSDSRRMVAAIESLFVSSVIRDCIRDRRRTGEIRSFMRRDADSGSKTLDTHLYELYAEGIISKDTALANAVSPHDFDVGLHLE